MLVSWDNLVASQYCLLPARLWPGPGLLAYLCKINMFQLTRLRLGILATQQPIYLSPHHYLISEQQTFCECCQTYHFTTTLNTVLYCTEYEYRWFTPMSILKNSRTLPVHGLGGVVLEPEDEGDVVLSAPGRHIARQHPRQPPQPGHPDDRHWNKWQLDIIFYHLR